MYKNSSPTKDDLLSTMHQEEKKIASPYCQRAQRELNGFSRLLAAIVGLNGGCWDDGTNDAGACGVKGEAG